MSRQERESSAGSVPVTQDVGKLFTYALLGIVALLVCLWFFRPGRATRVPESVLRAARTASSHEEPVAVTAVTAKRPVMPEIDHSSARPYSQWSVPETAFDSLGRIGRAAVPLLIETLHHAQPEHRVSAARLLGRIGPDAEDAVPALVIALKDPNEEVRKAVVRALGEIGPASATAVQSLLQMVIEQPAGADPPQ